MATADMNHVPARLLDLAKALRDRTYKLGDSLANLSIAKEQLEAEESRLLASGLIDGKNAEIRAAQLAEKTKEQRALVRAKEREVEAAKYDLAAVEKELHAYEVLARFLGKEGA